MCSFDEEISSISFITTCGYNYFINFDIMDQDINQNNFISVVPIGDSFSESVDSDGKIALFINKNQTYEITIYEHGSIGENKFIAKSCEIKLSSGTIIKHGVKYGH